MSKKKRRIVKRKSCKQQSSDRIPEHFQIISDSELVHLNEQMRSIFKTVKIKKIKDALFGKNLNNKDFLKLIKQRFDGISICS